MARMTTARKLLLGLLGGGGSSFNPLSIAGVYWFDPWRGTFQDSALTTPAVATDDLVGGLVEQSGSGNNGAAATTKRPKLKPAGFGTGLPGLLYEAAQCLNANGLAAGVAGADMPYTDIVSVKLTNTAAYYAFTGAGRSSSAVPRIRNNAYSSVTAWGTNRRDDAAAGADIYGGTIDTNTHVVTFLFTGTALTVRVDGVTVVNGTALDKGTLTLDTWSMGAVDTNGGLDGAARALIGDVFHAARVLTLDEIAALEGFAAPRCGLAYPFDPVELTGPVAYRVFQRSGSTGDIAITGTIRELGTHDVEARFNGGAWATVAAGESGSFTGTLTGQPTGRGTLDVRLADIPALIVSVANVGIGDVYGILGQSNASGRGTNNQTYTDSGGLGASLFGNDYVWKNLADPTDSATNQVDTVSSDASPAAAGTIFPLLATLILANASVPVAFVPCAKGATLISQWQPGGNHQDRTTLYGSAVYRLLQTGCAGILWWQGEHDVGAGTSQAVYNASLDALADAIHTDLGVALMACKLQNCTGSVPANLATINAAIAEAWSDNANVLTGPDLSDIDTDDGFHLMTDAKLLEAATRWWTALDAALYP
jgi:hypothetical protein